ncbi:hypothetical protein COV16_07330, partial [Candidatus Woesearchaeota archaeon CG10_big_fil_rev_8_21_14_0_10_34_8]
MKKLMISMLLVFVLVVMSVFAADPTVTSTCSSSVYEDSAYSCTVTVVDSDGDLITYIAISDSFSGSTFGTDDYTDNSDGTASTETATVSWT